MPDWLNWTYVQQNLVWSIAWSLAATGGGIAVTKLGLGKLKTKSQMLWFGAGIFVIFLALAGIFKTTVQGPKLQAVLISTVFGPFLAEENTTIAVLIGGIINSGTIQTIATDFKVT